MLDNDWRPDGWPENPCDNCKRKEVDDYGLYCDLWCRKGTAWINVEYGASLLLEKLIKEERISEE